MYAAGRPSQLYIKIHILKKTAKKSIREQLEFENTYILELMHI